ncbi:MAG TPA: hypothetical protein VHY80_13330, partial [Stellaceae bacterium]|nr:hypothetical protein [Stellaceae bacterium]
KLESIAWEQLEPVLPWHIPSWDKCARLIRGAARAFLDRAWPREEFCRTFSTSEQFERAVQEIHSMWGGSHFLRKLRDRVDDGSIVATVAQKLILNQIGA